MNRVKELHANFISEISFYLGDADVADRVVEKCAKLTEDIAIEFGRWLISNENLSNTSSMSREAAEYYFEEFMETDIEKSIQLENNKVYKLDEWAQLYAEKITKNPTYQNYLRKAYIDGFWRGNSFK